MKRNAMTAAGLAGAMLLGLAGCAAPAAETPPAASAATPESAEAQAAAQVLGGHWEEQAIDMTGKDLVSSFLCGADGTVQIYLQDWKTGETTRQISRDNGATWTEEALPAWMDQVIEGEGWELSYLDSTPDGRWTLVWTLLEGQTPEQNQSRQWIVDPQGTVTPLDIGALFAGADWAVMPAFLDNETLALLPIQRSAATDEECYRWQMTALNLTDRSCRTLPGVSDCSTTHYEEDPPGSGNWVGPTGGMIAYTGTAGRYVYFAGMEEGAQLRVVDPETGSSEVWLEELPGNRPAALCADDDGNLYYLTVEGIYRLAAGGTLPELVMDGAGTHTREIASLELNSPFEVGIGAVAMNRTADGSFLVMRVRRDAQTLYRYSWVEG